jgi:hypothetical protein
MTVKSGADRTRRDATSLLFRQAQSAAASEAVWAWMARHKLRLWADRAPTSPTARE